MNHVYRVVWNKSLGAFQVASELITGSASGASRGESAVKMRSAFTLPALKHIAAAVAMLSATSAAFAIQGMTVDGTLVTNGSATSGSGWTWDGSNVTIDSSANLSSQSSQSGGEEVFVPYGQTMSNVTNNGTLSNNDTGIEISGTLTELDNTVTGVISSPNAIVVGGSIGTLNNDGIIGGTAAGTATASYGIWSGGGIGQAASSIGTLHNGSTGVIEGTYFGVFNDMDPMMMSGSSAITTLNNDGLITGGQGAIENYGTIGSINNTGTIQGPTAIYNGFLGTIGTITNSGTIAGDIVYGTVLPQTLTLAGGTGTTFGTLTGADSVSLGTITNMTGDVVFSGGNTLLNDNINVGTNTVHNAGGVLQVNQPVAITGNYTQAAAATLQIGVASGATTTGALSDTGYGRLVVSGNTSIDANSNVTLKSNGYAFAAGQRYVVIDTAGAATYNENTLHYSMHGVSGSVTGAAVTNNGNSDLVLTVQHVDASTTPTSPASPTAPATPATPTSPATPTTPVTSTTATTTPFATIPNAVSSLNGLLGYTGVSDASLLNLYDAALGSLSNATTESANRIGKQLTPTQTSTGAAAPTFSALDVVNAHMNSMHLASSEMGSGISTGESPLEWQVWGQGFGGHASQQERDNVDGYSANFGGALVGADRAVSDRWRVGGVFNYAHTAIDNSGDTSGDSTGVNSYGLLGYASYAGSPWYVNLSGGVVFQHYDTSRIVALQGFTGLANGSFSGQQYVARVDGGYPIAVGSATVTPVASLSYSYLNQNGYTETGGNGAALAIGGSHATSVRSALGAKLEKSYETKYGVIVPEVSAQWVHEYDQARQTTAARFAADTSGETAFTSFGMTPVSDVADLSVGVTLLRANNMSLTARYELQAGSGFVSSTGILRLQQKF
ncbi:autotransporter domain-containing protein [Pararobbsia alpina]|uniref:autotransporter domain-containing protein n=1 Tax=Pararobbsia alpina TaxID=621374 RepID=UPI0039A6C864